MCVKSKRRGVGFDIREPKERRVEGINKNG